MLRVGVIGCGDMGKNHVTAWLGSGQAELVAVSDVDEERARALAEPHGAQISSSWQELLQVDGLDAVSVCTPACFHAPISIAAAQAGLHVLCEKPMALSLAEADAMIAAAEANDVRLAIAHQYRWNPDSIAMAQLVDAGALGSPLIFRFQDVREVRPKTAMHSAALSGGPIQDMTGHWFDLVARYTGAEACSVQAVGFTFGKGKERLAELSDHAPDTAEIQVSYSDGHVASLGICWGLPEGTPAHGGTGITGPLGHLRSDSSGVVLHSADGSSTISTEKADARAAMIEDFLGAIERQDAPTVNGSAGRAALALSLAALESLRTGQVVAISR